MATWRDIKKYLKRNPEILIDVFPIKNEDNGFTVYATDIKGNTVETFDFRDEATANKEIEILVRNIMF